jgi:prepilin-type N-terminal cleavage/methylation domain-containing protein
MNKKGLTLIELLAVITIIGLVLLVVLPNLDTLSKRAKEQEYDQAVTILKNATKNYIDQIDSSGLNNIGDYKEITLGDLAQAKLIQPPFTNPKTGDVLPLTSVVKVTKIDVNKFDYQLPL